MKIRRYLIPFSITLLIACGLSFTHTSAKQGNANSFTLDQVLSSPFSSELVGSPKGDRVAWVFNVQGKRNIWAAEGPSFKAHRLTNNKDDDGIEISSLMFSH
ncbi:MAG: hypothetical protein J2P31_09805, partial [Blastocatellia bacterium]|nr:hypothetical protein [Blastocatellia bacterium]